MLPEAGRDARGGHVAGLLSFLPDEQIAQVLAVRDYQASDYLLLATRRGLVKKTELSLYDSPRQAGIIAVNFRDDDDELIGADLCGPTDEVLLISTKGQAIRFPANDEELRPMGRATSGVTGMKFRPDDELLSMSIIRTGDSEEDRFVFTVTDGGFAKRTAVAEYRQQGRGGLGIKAMKLAEDRGKLVGGVVVNEADEVIALKAGGQVTRTRASEVPVKGRDTMGVRFVGVREKDTVVAIALYPEVTEAEVEAVEAEVEAQSGEPDVVSESAESGVPVQVLEAQESPASHGGSESAVAEDESVDPVDDDSID